MTKGIPEPCHLLHSPDFQFTINIIRINDIQHVSVKWKS